MRTPEFTFHAVNDFVHTQDAHYEELQCLCIELIGEIDRLKSLVSKLEAGNELALSIVAMNT